MKLSKRQQEVILHMREGNPMYKNVSYVILVNNHCSLSTFWALRHRLLIKAKGRYNPGKGVEYVLTKEGNSIIT